MSIVQNIAESANELLDALKIGSFHGVKASSIQREGVWHEQYAIFLIDWNFGVDFTEPSEYRDNSFDEDRFNDDFEKCLKKQFPGADISYNQYCNEYEIIGQHNEAFYAAHKDRIEELCDSVDGVPHWVFDHNKLGKEQMIKGKN